jgi:hypothetical protein
LCYPERYPEPFIPDRFGWGALLIGHPTPKDEAHGIVDCATISTTGGNYEEKVDDHPGRHGGDDDRFLQLGNA